MENLDKLLYWRGIADSYFNYRGERVEVSPENRVRLVKAMGVDIDCPKVIDEHSFELDVAPWMNWLPPLLMTEAGTQTHFHVNLSPTELDRPFTAKITLESGEVIRHDFLPGQFPEVGDYSHGGVRFSRRAIAAPALPIGYHRLEVAPADSDKISSAQFIVVPAQAFVPDWVTDGQRPWGLIIQLYTLRSARNWGIGDFTDLKMLVTEAAAAGAAMVGLNPLHALRNPVDSHCSPYSPSDRRYINPMYIDPEIEDDFRIEKETLLAELVPLRAAEKVQYGPVNDLKMRVFRGMYTVFVREQVGQETARAASFAAFKTQQGQALRNFCLYQTLTTETGQVYGELGPDERTALCREHADSIDFHAYLQWVANEQLGECQRLARDRGMLIGLMRDLAVGADGGGAEVETNLHLFRREAAVGAPPDPLAEKGQNWGLPPMDPFTLRETRFEHFIDLLRTNMSHCGALRMDHAMSLMRLWWCPPGHTADHGAYVYYPFRELLGLLKLESVRNRCLVIGEDMGVVPAEFRDALVKSSIFTNKMFYFEKDQQGKFQLPSTYERRSLAMLTNHDVPTLASWWVASDLELRESLNLLEEGADFAEILAQRDTEKIRLLEWLEALQLIRKEQFAGFLVQPMSQELAAAILHGISQCRSQLFVVQLEDLELLDEPVNVPGTSFEYPNWQRKLAVPLEILFSEENVQALLKAIAMERA